MQVGIYRNYKHCQTNAALKQVATQHVGTSLTHFSKSGYFMHYFIAIICSSEHLVPSNSVSFVNENKHCQKQTKNKSINENKNKK